jgi:hypothetical protein
MSLIRNIAILLIAGTVGASAQQKPAVDTGKIDAAIAAAFPTARPTGRRASTRTRR